MLRTRSVIDSEIEIARRLFLAADENEDYETGDAYFALLQLLSMEAKAIPTPRLP